MEEILRIIAAKVFPDLKITEICDRGVVIKHNFLLKFNDGSEYYVKFNIRNEWADLNHECKVVEILKENHISIPDIIYSDDKCSISPYPYIIQKQSKGMKLSDAVCAGLNMPTIFEAVAKYYGSIHSVKNEISGLWDKADYRKRRYPISPYRYMFDAEISRGSGLQLLKKGKIPVKLYEDISSAWERNLDFLESAQPSMVHTSAFYWNIYVDDSDSVFEISKITALGDFMWWDPMWDVALILNPPFFKCEAEWSKSFIEAYEPEIDFKRTALYSLMQGISALNGVYMEPSYVDGSEWRDRILEELALNVDKILGNE